MISKDSLEGRRTTKKGKNEELDEAGTVTTVNVEFQYPGQFGSKSA